MAAPTRDVRILLADDHAMFRDAVRSLIEQEPGLCVVGEVSNGSEVMEQARKLKPDLLLLDLIMPRMSGLEVLRMLQHSRWELRTILLVADISRLEIIEALKLGARGIVMKHAATQLLFKSIQAVMAGEYWIGRENVGDLVECVRTAPGSPGNNGNGASHGLSPRELQITAALIEGCTNKDIAKEFALSEQTVKHHLTKIFAKVGVSNRLELALFAIQHRLF